MTSELNNSRRWFLFFAVASLLAVAVAIVFITVAIQRSRAIQHSELEDAVIRNFELNKEDREKRYNALQAELDVIKRSLGIDEQEPMLHNTAIDWRIP